VCHDVIKASHVTGLTMRMRQASENVVIVIALTIIGTTSQSEADRAADNDIARRNSRSDEMTIVILHKLYIHRVQKKGATDFFAVTFTNIDGFS